MSQKTLNLCLERYNFVKFGETTKSSHTVLCINNAYSVNSDKYRLTPAAIAGKHGDGYVFTLNYDFDRPLFTIVQKSYALDGTSGNIVFEGIDPVSKGGSKYLRKVTVSPVKLSDGSYLLEVTNDEYLRIGTTGAALGDEDLESLNEKIVTMGGIEKSIETVGGKQVLKLDAGGPSGAKEIVYFEIDPSDPPSGIYDNITVALSNDKEPVIRIDGAVYFYTAAGTDKYVFVGGYTKDAVGYTEIEVSDVDSVTSKSVDDKVFNMFLLYKTDPASPGDPPGDEDSWVCDANKHVITKDELVAAHADCRYFILNNDVDPDSNSRKYFAAVTNVSNSYVQLRFYMVEYSGEGAANFYQKTVSNDSEGRLYISDSYQTYLAGTSQVVLVSEPQSFNATQKAQGRDNIGAASASDVTALQSQVSSLSDVSAYSVKGEATVAQLNAGPSGIQAGWAYQLTDSGTLTDGSLAVVAGDTVAWDGTKWFPLVRSDYYATKTYAQNVAHSIAPAFDPTRTSDNPYKAGESVTYTDGKTYTFKVPHYGAWTGTDVKEFTISDAFAVDNDNSFKYNDNFVLNFTVENAYVKGSDGSQSTPTQQNCLCTPFIKVPSLKLLYTGSVGYSACGVAFYDINKSFLSSVLYTPNELHLYENYEITIPKNAVYFRASATSINNYDVVPKIVASSSLPDIRSDIASLELDVTGKKESFMKDGYLASGVVWQGFTQHSINILLNVQKGDEFSYSGTFGYSACAFITLHEGSQVQAYGNSAGQPVPAVFTVPDGVDQILFSSYSAKTDTPTIDVKKLNSVFEKCNLYHDRLLGKKIVFDGDSICAGVTGIPLDDPKRGWGWAHRIGEAHSMDWHNVSVSGGTVCSDTYYFTAITGSPDWSNTYYVRNASATSTLDLYVQVTESTWDGHSTLYTKGSARHWESTYVETIHTNYPNLDYLIFESCLNDMFNGVPKGELAAGYTAAFETTQFIPALEHLFQLAITLYPQAKLGLIIPHMTSSGSSQKSWVDAAISVCKKWAIPFINLFEESGLVYPMTSQQGLLYADNAHLLSAGYDFITPKIESWIASL